MTLLDIKIGVSLQRFTTIRCNSLRVIMSPSQNQDVSRLLYNFRSNIYLFVLVITKFLLLFLFTDNLTEALMFLSHFIGDVHQVCSFTDT